MTDCGRAFVLVGDPVIVGAGGYAALVYIEAAGPVLLDILGDATAGPFTRDSDRFGDRLERAADAGKLVLVEVARLRFAVGVDPVDRIGNFEPGVLYV